MSSRKKKKNSRKGILTLLAILILLLCFLFHSYLGRKDNLLDLKVDDNLIKEEDNEDKMEVSEGGGAVSLSYSNQVVIDKAKGNINIYLKNPSKSRESLKIEMYAKASNNDILIGESGLIPPGNSLKLIKLINLDLIKTEYDGYMKIKFYNEEDLKEEIVDSKINVKIDVK